MHKDEIPRRRPGHREASASAAAALAAMSYPLPKEEAIRRVGEWTVPYKGQRIPLAPLLEGIPVETFQSPEEALRLVDQHWGRMEERTRSRKEP